MKKWILPVLGVFLGLLVSCAGIPSAEKPTDTLVIGSFLVDFPDGFFNEEPRTFSSGIALTFTNVTSGSSFTIITADKGYFWFLSNGTDSYELARYHYDYVSGSRHRFVLDSKIGYSFTTTPQSLLYVGHLELIYARPQRPDPTAYGRHQTVEWDFDTTWNRDFRTGEMSAHLSTLVGGPPWLSHTIVSIQEIEKRSKDARAESAEDAP